MKHIVSQARLKKKHKSALHIWVIRNERSSLLG